MCMKEKKLRNASFNVVFSLKDKSIDSVNEAPLPSMNKH